MNKIRYCPNCVSEMCIERCKLGRVRDSYVYTSCGVREQLNQEQESLIIRINDKI